MLGTHLAAYKLRLKKENTKQRHEMSYLTNFITNFLSKKTN